MQHCRAVGVGPLVDLWRPHGDENRNRKLCCWPSLIAFCWLVSEEMFGSASKKLAMRIRRRTHRRHRSLAPPIPVALLSFISSLPLSSSSLPRFVLGRVSQPSASRLQSPFQFDGNTARRPRRTYLTRLASPAPRHLQHTNSASN